MQITKTILLGFCASMLLLYNGCQPDQYGCTDPGARNYDVSADIDDGSCIYGIDPQEQCDPDLIGNLTVINQTGSSLYLYKDLDFVSCIPADTESFLLNIPNQELLACKLQIWKSDDVPDKLSPPIQSVYRQWQVALSNTTLPEERSTWLITGIDTYAGSGTLLVNYPSIDEYGHEVIYQVDIYLNNKSGAKMASLQPGVVNKKVSLDYGVHYLYFHYWYSDPNSSTGEILDIGWSEIRDVVINDYHQEYALQIPVIYSVIGKYGELKILNNHEFAVNVYANDKLIEEIAKVEGSSQGLSVIPQKSETVFLIPVGNYTITTKDLQGNVQQIFKSIIVVQSEKAILTSGISYKSIQIVNNTDVQLGLFNLKEEFMGYVVNANSTSALFLVPETSDSLYVIDFGRTKSRLFSYNASVTINDLVDYVVNRINYISTWPMLDEVTYQSPVIDNAGVTSMEAGLINDEDVFLSFEFNVSSERDYDFFQFSVDGTLEIEPISGESDWILFSLKIPAGEHMLKWVYSKDEMFGMGRDNVQVRNIRIE